MSIWMREKIAKLRKDLAREQTTAFLGSMEQMGFTMR